MQRRNFTHACSLPCVELCNSGSSRSRNNLGTEIVRFSAFNSVFVHAKYTSNMTACYDSDFNDVTVPHLLTESSHEVRLIPFWITLRKWERERRECNTGQSGYVAATWLESQRRRRSWIYIAQNHEASLQHLHGTRNDGHRSMRLQQIKLIPWSHGIESWPAADIIRGNNRWCVS